MTAIGIADANPRHDGVPDDWALAGGRWLEAFQQPIGHIEDLKLAEQRRRENSFEAVSSEFIRLNVIGPNPGKPRQRKGREVERQ